MLRTMTACLLATLVACAPAEQTPDAEPPAAAGPNLADFAGTWTMTSTLTGVENPVMSTMVATAADTGWTMMLEGRDPLPLSVSVSGDSVITQTPEYESILRVGVMVSVRTAGVMHGSMMMGSLQATYRTADGTEVVNGTFEGTRPAP